MKIILQISLCFCALLICSCSSTAAMQEGTIGIGVSYTIQNISSQSTKAYVVSVDLKNEAVELQLHKANNELFAGAPVSEIFEQVSKSESPENQKPVVAINADFFEGDYSPTGILVIDGEFWKGPASLPSTDGLPRTIFAVNNNDEIFMGRPDFEIGIKSESGESFLVDRINFPETHTESTLYTHHFGDRSGLKLRGQSQVVLEITEGGIPANGRVEATIKGIGPGPSAELGDQAVVLHAPAPLPDWMSANSKVTISTRLKNAPSEFSNSPIKFISGGLPLLVQDGTASPIGFSIAEDFPMGVAEGSYPRTAIGFDEENNILHLVVTDGYKDGNAGLTLIELADWFVENGCSHAINFDGGSSSTIIINGELINNPGRLEGSEMPISTALFVLNKV